MFDLLKSCFFPKGGLAYPGRIITLYGKGTLHSCGPTRLDKNKDYLLFGKMFISNTKAKKKLDLYVKMWNINNVFHIITSVYCAWSWIQIAVSITQARQFVLCFRKLSCFFLIKEAYKNFQSDHFIVYVIDTLRRKSLYNLHLKIKKKYFWHFYGFDHCSISFKFCFLKWIYEWICSFRKWCNHK